MQLVAVVIFFFPSIFVLERRIDGVYGGVQASFVSKWPVISMVCLYSLSTPIGTAIGVGVNESYKENSEAALLAIGMLECISAGILIYDRCALRCVAFIYFISFSCCCVYYVYLFINLFTTGFFFFFSLLFCSGLQLGQHCCAALQVRELRQAGDVVKAVAFRLFLAGRGGHVFYWKVCLAAQFDVLSHNWGFWAIKQF